MRCRLNLWSRVVLLASSSSLGLFDLRRRPVVGASKLRRSSVSGMELGTRGTMASRDRLGLSLLDSTERRRRLRRVVDDGEREAGGESYEAEVAD